MKFCENLTKKKQGRITLRLSLSKKGSDVSELTRPRLCAFGQEDSGLLFSQLCIKNKIKSINFKTK